MSLFDKKNNAPIKVYMRQRPLSSAELDQRCVNVVHSTQLREVVLKNGFNERKFVCDHFFGAGTSPEELYQASLAPMINNVIAGYNCTLLAYGQSGSGKTYSIFGEMNPWSDTPLTKADSVGLVVQASRHLFAELSKLSVRTEYTVRVSLVEIQNEEVRDLYSDCTPIRIYDDPLIKGAVCMKELSNITVFNSQDVIDWINVGFVSRQKAHPHAQNSRSHFIFTFLVNIREVNDKGDEIIKSGKLQLFDLAGNEYTGRERARDAGSANRSINTLTRVIRALSQKLQHIPYRDSKLTRILQESLSGNTKTAIIATFSPSSSCWDETVATLELAQFARSIITNSHVNVNKKQANLLKELDAEVTRLQTELAAARRGEGVFVSSQTFQMMTGAANKDKQQIYELVTRITELTNHRTSLDVQYHALQQSFDNSKAYLEKINTALAERQRDLQETQAELKRALKDRKYMADVTNKLIDVCNSSTTNENIYYNKYKEKSAATTRNVEVSKDMIATTSSCLDFTRSETEDIVSEMFATLQDVKESMTILSKDSEECTAHMSVLRAEIVNYMEKYNLVINNLLEGPTNNMYLDLQKFIKNEYKYHLTNLEQYKTLSSKMQTIWKEQENDIHQIGVYFMHTFDKVMNAVEREERSCEKYDRALANVTVMLQNRKHTLNQQLQQNNAAAAFSRREIARVEGEREVLRTRTTALDEAMSGVKAVQDNDSRSCLAQLQENVTGFSQNVVNVANASVSKINETSDQIDVFEKKASDEADAAISALRKLVEGMQASASESLSYITMDVGRNTKKWRRSIHECQGFMLHKLKPSVYKINMDLDTYLRRRSLRSYGIKKRAAEAKAKLDECSTSVSNVGHAGDTPVKRQYNYPKKFGGPRRNGTPKK